MDTPVHETRRSLLVFPVVVEAVLLAFTESKTLDKGKDCRNPNFTYFILINRMSFGEKKFQNRLIVQLRASLLL